MNLPFFDRRVPLKNIHFFFCTHAPYCTEDNIFVHGCSGRLLLPMDGVGPLPHGGIIEERKGNNAVPN